MEELKFTQEIKDKWLEALKSGKYTQTYGSLRIDRGTHIEHCCIGVLGEILGICRNEEPYAFLYKNLSRETTDLIWQINDRTFNPSKPDYSNVIPLIETLEVKE